MKKKLSWKKRLLPVVEKMNPTIKVVERMAHVAIHMHKPTLLGSLGTLSAGISALNDMVHGAPKAGWGLAMPVSRGYVMDALAKAGANLSHLEVKSGKESTAVLWQEYEFTVNHEGRLWFDGVPTSGLFKILREALDQVLPPVLEIRSPPPSPANERGSAVESMPIELEVLRSQQGVHIWEATKPLLGNGRCILLNGRPGVGKTTMAREIAHINGLGRVVQIDSALVGSIRSTHGKATPGIDTEVLHQMHLLSAGTILVDDVDKIHFGLPALEMLRSSSKLVILTSNNGDFDGVLDGAMMRPGRVDEMFNVEPEPNLVRRPPFTQLSDEEWTEISQWPIAFLNEVEQRLLHRSYDLRLDDLRQQLHRRVRSGQDLPQPASVSDPPTAVRSTSRLYSR